ncbi:MAG: type II toxin-antitoxin system Phd/YefM family antitoxin [Actinobacteria bacterium]|nr:type II toxin-antitoxin system Phd/YefM family antitoxin [Actinomycetota bacterium]
MRRITATELARNLSRILDTLTIDGGEIVVERNQRVVARLLPGGRHQTALEAMADLYRTLPEDAAAGWLADSRGAPSLVRLADEVRDPWAGTNPAGGQPPSGSRDSPTPADS